MKPQASKWNGIRWSSKSTCNHSQLASRAPADAAATKAVATPCLRCAMVTIFQDEGVPRPVPGNVHPGRVVGRNRTHTSAGRGPATGNRGPTHPPRHEGSDACLRVATCSQGHGDLPEPTRSSDAAESQPSRALARSSPSAHSREPRCASWRGPVSVHGPSNLTCSTWCAQPAHSRFEQWDVTAFGKSE